MNSGSMQVRVLYFAALRERLGVDQEKVEVPLGSKVEDLLSLLRARDSKWEKACDPSGSLRVAVDLSFAELTTDLSPDCEVGLFPPVTGG